MRHNDYDEKVLSRSREPIDMGGRPYVDWSQYQTVRDSRPLIWVASILIVSLVIWACVTLAR